MELHLAAYQLCLAFRLETTSIDGPYHLISQPNWFIFLPLQRTGIFPSNIRIMPVRCTTPQIFAHTYRGGVDHFQKLIKVNMRFCIGNPKLFSNKDGILLRHIWGRSIELGMLSCGGADPAWPSWLGFSGICRRWRPQIARGMIAHFVQELMEDVIERESWFWVWMIRSERGDGNEWVKRGRATTAITLCIF